MAAVAAAYFTLTPFAMVCAFIGFGVGDAARLFLIPYFVFCRPMESLNRLGLAGRLGRPDGLPVPLLNTALWVGALYAVVTAGAGLIRPAVRHARAADNARPAGGGGVVS